MRSILLSIVILALGAFTLNAEGVKSYKIKAEFEQVQQDAADAIINRGYVIDYTGHIGAMLNRTSGDVGAQKKVFSNATVMQFCSAVLSRKVMEDDAQNIAFCPYGVFVYELDANPGEIIVGFRKLPDTTENLKTVNKLLDDIVREAAEIK